MAGVMDWIGAALVLTSIWLYPAHLKTGCLVGIVAAAVWFHVGLQSDMLGLAALNAGIAAVHLKNLLVQRAKELRSRLI